MQQSYHAEAACPSNPTRSCLQVIQKFPFNFLGGSGKENLPQPAFQDDYDAAVRRVLE